LPSEERQRFINPCRQWFNALNLVSSTQGASAETASRPSLLSRESRLWLIARLVIGHIERVRLVPGIGIGMQISLQPGSFAVNSTHRQDVDMSSGTEKVLRYEFHADHESEQLFLLVS
jgi:hypothetical protein